MYTWENIGERELLCEDMELKIKGIILNFTDSRVSGQGHRIGAVCVCVCVCVCPHSHD